MKTWHAFAFLIFTAVLIYCAKTSLLILAAIVGFFRALRWLDACACSARESSRRSLVSGPRGYVTSSSRGLL
jgi:hypothetical protein